MATNVPRCFNESLLEAAKMGQTEMVESVIKAGANVNFADRTKSTALHYAAKGGHKDIVAILIKEGADLEQTDRHGQIPLKVALEEGHGDCVAQILETAQLDENGRGVSEDTLKGWAQNLEVGDEEKSLMEWAAENGHARVVKALATKCGADVKERFEIEEEEEVTKESTALISAATNGHHAVVEVLINLGAKPDDCDFQGTTALMAAAFEGHVECVRVLLQAGARVDLSNCCNRTALFEAADHGHADCVELLLKHNADLNYANNFKLTPLMCAALEGHTDCVKVLIEHNAELQLTDVNGESALWNAATQSHLQCALALLQAGAIPDERALSSAVEEDASESVELLLQHGKFQQVFLDEVAQKASPAVKNILQTVRQGVHATEDGAGGHAAPGGDSTPGGADRKRKPEPESPAPRVSVDSTTSNDVENPSKRMRPDISG